MPDSNPLPQAADVVIVGGGLAGLACARTLHAAGVDYLLLEAENEIGGRVRTDSLGGFLLDRGFQVLLTAYPEAQRILDYERLDLQRFEPGALVHRGGRFHLTADPIRRPRHALRSLVAPIGTLRDKLLVWQLRRRVTRGEARHLFAGPDGSTLDSLRTAGFSPEIIESFFRPFFGGVFLEPDLATSSHWFHLLYRMFATGDTAVPARGMGEIPRQIAAGLDPEKVQTRCRVARIEGGRVETETGVQIACSRVVIATEEPARRRLLRLGQGNRCTWNGTHCLYYAAPKSPLGEPYLVLNGDGEGPIRNLTVLTDVAPSYSASGEALISISLSGEASQKTGTAIQSQLEKWFGTDSRGWRLLRTYTIPHALPFQAPGALQRRQTGPGAHNIFCCGDDLETASIQGALVSGRRAAESILSEDT